MPGGVNQVEKILLLLILIRHLYGVALDGDSALTFKIHIVKNLIVKITLINGTGLLKKSVGKSALAMVYVRYYAKVAYIFHQSPFGSIQVQIYTI